MLALSAPELEETKRAHAALLEKFVALGDFDADNAATRSWQDKLRASAEGLPVALRQARHAPRPPAPRNPPHPAHPAPRHPAPRKLALDAYYTWLADLSEQMDRKSLEQAAANSITLALALTLTLTLILTLTLTLTLT